MSEPCRYFINGECTHAPAYEGRKLGKRPSPGGHAACEYNTSLGQWPEITPLTVSATPPPPPVTMPVAVPADQWPLWAKLMKMFAQAGDAGLGDTIARMIGPIGGDKFKAWYKEKTGEDCGCRGRQEWLNARFPY